MENALNNVANSLTSGNVSKINSDAASKLNQTAKTTEDKNAAKSEVAAKKLADDFDSFLLLLTTQLKNQDPTEPLDTNEFTQQLVMFAGVEQQIDTNTNLEKLVGASVTSEIQQGLGYIGKNIEANGDKGVLIGGRADFAYELPTEASKVDIAILDSTGKSVFSGNGATNSGKNIAVWDGKNSFTGEDMPEGTYQMVIKAKGFKDEEMEVKTFTTGKVTAVETDKDKNVVLSVGSQKVKLSDVISVREVPTSTRIANAAQDIIENQEQEQNQQEQN
jgi:flagellar basal-body rod modification protein FlgD